MSEVDRKTLLKAFDKKLHEIYVRARDEADYKATIFLQMLHERGGLETARYLINSIKPSDGYTALWDRGYLELTVEATVLEDKKWHQLFTHEELDRARNRLKKYGYKKEIEI